MTTATPLSAVEPMLKKAREASYVMATLSSAQKNEALLAFADLIAEHQTMLLEANQKDLDAQQGQIAPNLYQRLKLDAGKLAQLVQGIRDVARLEDPVGKTLAKTKLDDGLILEKVSVPLGVLGIIFESRPDVIPQILSLALKSGNAVVLKGGSEAAYSNQAFMKLLEKLGPRFEALPCGWACLLEGREAAQAMLNYPQYVDLVIPRGSNQLVQSVMSATKIPVLGHADGVCHLYVHPSANFEKAIPLVIDAKSQYPAACNALETLLVDTAIASDFLSRFAQAAQVAGLILKGCEATRKILPLVEPATEDDWRAEYGDLTLSVKLVEGLDVAIQHINTYGSHHTDGILAEDPVVAERFMNAVDSASVYVNASTRFADGFRYGFGAEIGISTAKTHARGPVGLEGLVIYKYKLCGQGHIVKDYVGESAKPFLHEPV